MRIDRMDRPRDEHDWNQWLRAHGARLLLFARTQTRREADAHDVLQEVVARLARERSPRQDSLLPRALVGIRRAAIDLARRDQRRQRREESAALQEAPDPTEPVEWFAYPDEPDPTRARLAEAVRQLPPPQQEVLTLKLWQDLTFDQIGRLLGISANTAASRYRYALGSLRQQLTVSAP